MIFTPRLFAASEAVASNWKVAAVPGQPANALTYSATQMSPLTRCLMQRRVTSLHSSCFTGAVLTLHLWYVCGSFDCICEVHQSQMEHQGTDLELAL